jgi:hypothetical protein
MLILELSTCKWKNLQQYICQLCLLGHVLIGLPASSMAAVFFLCDCFVSIID